MKEVVLHLLKGHLRHISYIILHPVRTKKKLGSAPFLALNTRTATNLLADVEAERELSCVAPLFLRASRPVAWS